MTEQPTNGVLRYRVDNAIERLGKVEQWQAEVIPKLLVLDTTVASTEENRKSLREIVVAVGIGVIMLIITTVVAKLT